MRMERTGRGHEVREILEVTHCAACGQPFERYLATMSWSNCGCTPGSSGHRVVICLRGTCRARTFDPPCTARQEYHPLTGHDHRDPWADVQHGPTLDVGDS